MDMGVEPFLITSALLGVVGQRLLRKICSGCSEPDEPNPGLLRAIGFTQDQIAQASFRRGRGCSRCGGRGYRGRSAVYEVMKMTDAMRDAVLQNTGGSRIKDIAVDEGMETMRDSGVRKVILGETTLDEVCRVPMSEEAAKAVELEMAA